jgi:signal transduction histidine kinase/ActR/RegA family two-component response regulator
MNRWFVFSNNEANTLVHLEHQRQLLVVAAIALAILAGASAMLFTLYRQARQAKLAAEHSSEVKSEFLANVSHEVRTPMNGIIGMADLLVRSGLPPEQHGYALTIAESARVQLNILSDILDSAKIEAGRMMLERIPFSPETVARDVFARFESAAAAQSVALRLEISGAPAAVMGDPLRLQQVLANLVSNAVKFTESGSVTLAVAGQGEDTGRIEFSVIDTGIGITTDEQARIFEPFGQADRSTTRRYGGTGLGLTIAARLVSLMGGRLEVESAPGSGSRFSFHLHLEPAPQPSASADAARQVDLQCSLPVLVVEDNRTNQAVASALLRSLGIRPVLARDGEEAVNLCQAEGFSVILMDCHMPVMDGFEATRRIRALASQVRTPIIALTAAATPEDRKRALSAGMDDVLTKPVSHADLQAALIRHLPRSPVA